jgi:uncharacterized membrane protein YphA (DoxX/SURF4 family)
MNALALLARLLLGGVFVAAAIPKIADPPSFAHMISNYGILPPGLVNAAALLLPWIEMVSGIALIAGVFRRTAAKLIGTLLLVFVLGIGINLARNHAVQCGCFDVHAAEKSHDQLIREMRWAVIRDTALLAVVGFLLARGSEGRQRPQGGPEI